MNNEQFFNFVKTAHLGQTRWQGEDYFTAHCVPVAEYAVAHYKDFIKFRHDFIESNIDQLYNVGLAHDLLEDTTANPEILKEFDLYLYFDVDCLTKKKNQSYCDYIKGVAKHGSLIAKVIKLSDLTLNRIDLKPGARKDKYDLAELVIMNSMG
jgi:(p)ppGpp synthase/HD superfamily hydrolase